MALELCIFIFLKYPKSLTSVFFARSSFFSLLHICLPIIWIHVLPLQGKSSPTEWPLDGGKLGLEFVLLCWQQILKEILEDEPCSFLGRKWKRKYLALISNFVCPKCVLRKKKKSSTLVQIFEAVSQSWLGGFLCNQREFYSGGMWHLLEVSEYPYTRWLEEEPTNYEVLRQCLPLSSR